MPQVFYQNRKYTVVVTIAATLVSTKNYTLKRKNRNVLSMVTIEYIDEGRKHDTIVKEEDTAQAIQELVDRPSVRFIRIAGYVIPITHTVLVAGRTDLTIKGDGNGTLLKPTGDFDVFEFKSPLSRIVLSSMQIADDLSKPKQTASSVIRLNHSGNKGAINDLTMENLTMYYPFNGISSDMRNSDISNGLQVPTIRHVRINEYRNSAMRICNCFDGRFYDILATQPKKYNKMGLGHGFVIKNSIDSGTQMEMVTMLGEDKGIGFAFDNVTHITGSQFIADTHMEGMFTHGEVDFVKLSLVELRSSRDQGLYADHNKGRICIHQFTGRNSTNYHVKNFGRGGNVTILGGKVHETHKGIYSLAKGDIFEGIEGAPEYH